jgi:hypothetical protein
MHLLALGKHVVLCVQEHFFRLFRQRRFEPLGTIAFHRRVDRGHGFLAQARIDEDAHFEGIGNPALRQQAGQFEFPAIGCHCVFQPVAGDVDAVDPIVEEPLHVAAAVHNHRRLHMFFERRPEVFGRRGAVSVGGREIVHHGDEVAVAVLVAHKLAQHMEVVGYFGFPRA